MVPATPPALLASGMSHALAGPQAPRLQSGRATTRLRDGRSARPCVKAAPLFCFTRLWEIFAGIRLTHSGAASVPASLALAPRAALGPPASASRGREAGRLQVSFASRLRQREAGGHPQRAGPRLLEAPREGALARGPSPSSRVSPVRPAASSRTCVGVRVPVCVCICVHTCARESACKCECSEWKRNREHRLRLAAGRLPQSRG